MEGVGGSNPSASTISEGCSHASAWEFFVRAMRAKRNLRQRPAYAIMSLVLDAGRLVPRLKAGFSQKGSRV